MQKVILTEHNVRRVFQRLLEIYKPMQRGEEEQFNYYFLCMEGNMLNRVRKDGSLNSRRAREAVDLCLASINGYLNGIEYDFSSLAKPGNLALMKALQMAYDPFINPEIAAVIEKKWDINDGTIKQRLFFAPFQCLYRLRESIDTWIEMAGSNGYLQMVEREFGPLIDPSEGDKWTILMLQ